MKDGVILCKTEEIKIPLIKTGKTVAEALGTSLQNLSNKICSVDFKVIELEKVAKICLVKFQYNSLLEYKTKYNKKVNR